VRRVRCFGAASVSAMIRSDASTSSSTWMPSAGSPEVSRLPPPRVLAEARMSPARRRTDPGAVRIPAGLGGPVDVALAGSVETIPGPNALPGGTRFEPKWDGFLH
jgi:hypothetical protein